MMNTMTPEPENLNAYIQEAEINHLINCSIQLMETLPKCREGNIVSPIVIREKVG